ncbi:MAG: hypothetical protein HY673_10025 [Chloroflexi bacterium]|nr:hypothetical protein [Chloroflexota bacterium]
MTIEITTVYFEKPGRVNTDRVLHIARKRAEELGIKTVVVGSSTGRTAARAVDILRGIRVVAVSLSTGFTHGAPRPNVQRFTEANRALVEGKGGAVLTTTHAFAGVSRSIRNKYKTYTHIDIIANTLKIFGSGMKVACEITLMAADSGLVRTCDEDIIAIGGTAGGADTAIVLQPVISQDFFDLKVKEILCKPRF